MKSIKSILFILAFAYCVIGKAQSPFKFNYQTVIRDNAGAILVNQNMKLRIKLFDTSIGGNLIYQEEHNNLSTNEFGLVTLQIGMGSVSVGTTLDKLNWSEGEKWIENELSVGNNGFNVVGQRSQLVAVPYALNSQNAVTAKLAENATNADNAKTAQTAVSAEKANEVMNLNLITAESTWWMDKTINKTNEWVNGDVKIEVPQDGKYLLLTEARAFPNQIAGTPNVHAIHARVIDESNTDPNASLDYIVGNNAAGANGLPVTNGDGAMIGHQFLNLKKGTKIKLQFFAFSNTGLPITKNWTITGPQSLHLIRLSN